MRKYACGFWVGDDHDEIEYESRYRNGSRANREDAMRAIRRKRGRYVWKRAEIAWSALVRQEG